MASMREQRIASELRSLRGTRTSTDVQRALGITPSKLSRIESSAVRPQPKDIEALARFYGAPVETINRLVAAAEATKQPAWWTPFIGPDWDAALVHHLEMETEAVRLDSWMIDLVPGLLQIPSYVRALIESRADVDPAQTERRMELRALRRARVERGELEIWAVLWEGVLINEVGGPNVLADQLQYLHDAPSNVTIQVLPAKVGAHAGHGNSFHVLRFDDWPDVVYQDTLMKGLYQDDPETVRVHNTTMEHLRAAALSPRQSRAVLAQRIAELEGQR